jgi:hypothetical protein
MDRGEAEGVVARLGEALGIAGLALDEGGICTLAIDDGAVIVSLGHNPAAGTLDLMICLDEVVPDAGLATRLLQANFGWRTTGGASFAVEPVSGAVVLQRRVGAAEAGGGGVIAALEALVATAQAWAARLGEAAAPPEGTLLPPDLRP